MGTLEVRYWGGRKMRDINLAELTKKRTEKTLEVLGFLSNKDLSDSRFCIEQKLSTYLVDKVANKRIDIEKSFKQINQIEEESVTELSVYVIANLVEHGILADGKMGSLYREINSLFTEAAPYNKDYKDALYLEDMANLKKGFKFAGNRYFERKEKGENREFFENEAKIKNRLNESNVSFSELTKFFMTDNRDVFENFLIKHYLWNISIFKEAEEKITSCEHSNLKIMKNIGYNLVTVCNDCGVGFVVNPVKKGVQPDFIVNEKFVNYNKYIEGQEQLLMLLNKGYYCKLVRLFEDINKFQSENLKKLYKLDLLKKELLNNGTTSNLSAYLFGMKVIHNKDIEKVIIKIYDNEIKLESLQEYKSTYEDIREIILKKIKEMDRITKDKVLDIRSNDEALSQDFRYSEKTLIKVKENYDLRTFVTILLAIYENSALSYGFGKTSYAQMLSGNSCVNKTLLSSALFGGLNRLTTEEIVKNIEKMEKDNILKRRLISFNEGRANILEVNYSYICLIEPILKILIRSSDVTDNI